MCFIAPGMTEQTTCIFALPGQFLHYQSKPTKGHFYAKGKGSFSWILDFFNLDSLGELIEFLLDRFFLCHWRFRFSWRGGECGKLWSTSIFHNWFSLHLLNFTLTWFPSSPLCYTERLHFLFTVEASDWLVVGERSARAPVAQRALPSVAVSINRTLTARSRWSLCYVLFKKHLCHVEDM